MSQERDHVVIAAAKRSPIGNFNGVLSSLSAVDIGAAVVSHVLYDSGVEPGDVDEVIMGQVLTAGAGQNPARQTAIDAAIPEDRTALTVNQVCGSGLRSIAMAYQSILCGDSDIVVAGGQESMSQAPHCMHLRRPTKMGDAGMRDTMILDGLWDAFNDYHMGVTAETIAEKFSISRQAQDEFAATSQQRAEKAIQEGRFRDEIVPLSVKSRKETVTVDSDEFPRPGVTAEGLGELKPAFAKDGTVTPGNSSGLNDGAAAVLVMRESTARQKDFTPLAKIHSWASAGVDPSVMGTGPIPAVQKALDKAQWDVGDLELVESNEAFAAQACCVMQKLGLDPDKVNVNGGAIALGHPIGASGARVTTTLLHEMQRRDASKGLATLCIGGGMGIAMCFER